MLADWINEASSCSCLPPAISCLFANTNNKASFISLSNMILCSSCLASSIRPRSFESMTKIRPCVPVLWRHDQYLLDCGCFGMGP